MLNSIVTYGIHFSWTRKKHEKPVFQNYFLRLIKDSEVFFAVGKGGKFLNELWCCISAQGHYKKIWLSTEAIR